jgi:hypothetical protein
LNLINWNATFCPTLELLHKVKPACSGLARSPSSCIPVHCAVS